MSAKITLMCLLYAFLHVTKATKYCYLTCNINGSIIVHSACKTCGLLKECMEKHYGEHTTTKHRKQQILDVHNTVRNNLVSGKLTLGTGNQMKIAYMAYINYSDELERLAFCWLRKCKGIRDPCPRTEIFPYVQQNMFTMYSSSCDYRIVTSEALYYWHNEVMISNRLAYICSKPNTEETGVGCNASFSQVLHGSNALVGCALIRTGKRRQCTLACNYAPGYLPTFKTLYVEGQPASHCGYHDVRYPYLCGKQTPISNTPTIRLSNAKLLFVLMYLLIKLLFNN